MGLDVGPEVCSLVVLNGSLDQPDSVCCAERLALPKEWVAQGEVLQALELGQWLQTYLQAGDYHPHMAYIGLDSACVSNHLVTLASGLSPDDVAFQLQIEVQSLQPDDVTEVCMDYRMDITPAPAGEQRYWVQTVPRPRVDVLQRVAQLAGVKAVVVEPRDDAAHRTERSETWLALPQAHVALALQCEAAFGLALRAWQGEGPNFLPHREDAPHVLRRAWLLGATAWAMGGSFLAACFAMVMAFAADSKQPHVRDVAASAHAFAQAQKAHQQAQALQDWRTAQARWFQARHVLQSQSLQWSRVLSQAAQGVWVTRVKQQGARWTVQGEALSAAHAQQLVTQLKALDIWAQAPELPQLQVVPAVSATGLPVWQFRIEADLKVGV
jgi:hypothetical protein